MTTIRRLLAYPPIEAHGVIGDRRTAALVAADGTLDWLCLPDYDGEVVFGALLDADRGGFWRLGPAEPALGRQHYLGDSMVLVTSWTSGSAELELTDAMALPQAERPAGQEARRVLLRRLRCTRGEADCTLDLSPRAHFGVAGTVEPVPGGAVFQVGDWALELWANRAVETSADGARATVRLHQGEDLWSILALGAAQEDLTVARADESLAEAVAESLDWATHDGWSGPRIAMVRRSSQVVHLLHHVRTGSLVAAPTTSLPERVGGDRNYDYRYAWVRDAALSAAVSTLLGDASCARNYLEWLSILDSSTDAPLQVVYHADGATDLTEHARADLAGYRGSRPVRFGNRAFDQHQLDSLGYLAECAWIFLDRGGDWSDAYWDLVRRAADHTLTNWREPDSGIWELPDTAHYVSSKVMSWVCLDRAVKIAERTGRLDAAAGWRAGLGAIHADVMVRGWNDRLGAFVQRYDAEALDASALLIPLMGFLAPDHPRAVQTVDRIADTLAVDGLVHRFIAKETPGHPDLPLGAFEGAFLPCTFWLATAYAQRGEPDRAAAILDRVEASAPLGLFAEEIDANSGALLGNFPLIFAHAEYVRAVLAIAEARGAGG